MNTQSIQKIALTVLSVLFLCQAGPRLWAEWICNPNMQHVWLTLPAGLYLAWRSWRSTRPTPPDWGPGVALLAAGSGVLFLDAALAEEMLLAAGCLLGALGGVALLAGRRRLRAVLFPALLIVLLGPSIIIVKNSGVIGTL